ncbi:MAG: response regulator transcription factor, partial [Methylobacter sp.]
MRLLLVEDDEILGEGLVEGLKMEGYAVDWLTNGKLADEALKLNTYELIVLDLNLPDMEGLDILKALRARKDETPVMVLTAKDTVPDRVLGLDSGADDFVIKPFELDEVCARLRALARRNEGRSVPNIEYKGIVLDPASHQVTWNDEKIDLSQKEFEILSFLMSNIGKVISRARLE